MYDLYVYGSGECDQLGVEFKEDDDLETSTPIKLSLSNFGSSAKIHTICCGGLHTLALTTMGIVYSWGCNDEGALGRDGNEKVPMKIEGLLGPMNNISAGDCHSIVYNNETNLFFYWGSYRNLGGMIGNILRKPVMLDITTINNLRISKALCGSNHTIVLAEGTVFSWGNWESGQTGCSPDESRDENDKDVHLIPIQLSSRDVVDIFTGSNHSFLITLKDSKRILKGWGNNVYGQLGTGNQISTWIPKEVSFGEDVSILSATGGEDHSLALSEDFEVYSWGRNDDNQCGFLTNREKGVIDEANVSQDNNKTKKDFFLVPTKIDFFSQKDKIVKELKAKMHYNYAYNSETGKVYSWGLGENFVLGNQSYQNQKQPFELPNTYFNSLNVGQMSLGSQHVVVALLDSSTGFKKPVFEYDLNTVKKEQKFEVKDSAGAVKRKDPTFNVTTSKGIVSTKKTPNKESIDEGKKSLCKITPSKEFFVTKEDKSNPKEAGESKSKKGKTTEKKNESKSEGKKEAPVAIKEEKEESDDSSKMDVDDGQLKKESVKKAVKKSTKKDDVESDDDKKKKSVKKSIKKDDVESNDEKKNKKKSVKKSTKKEDANSDDEKKKEKKAVKKSTHKKPQIDDESSEEGDDDKKKKSAKKTTKKKPQSDDESSEEKEVKSKNKKKEKTHDKKKTIKAINSEEESIEEKKKKSKKKEKNKSKSKSKEKKISKSKPLNIKNYVEEKDSDSEESIKERPKSKPKQKKEEKKRKLSTSKEKKYKDAISSDNEEEEKKETKRKTRKEKFEEEEEDKRKKRKHKEAKKSKDKRSQSKNKKSKKKDIESDEDNDDDSESEIEKKEKSSKSKGKSKTKSQGKKKLKEKAKEKKKSKSKDKATQRKDSKRSKSKKKNK